MNKPTHAYGLAEEGQASDGGGSSPRPRWRREGQAEAQLHAGGNPDVVGRDRKPVCNTRRTRRSRHGSAKETFPGRALTSGCTTTCSNQLQEQVNANAPNGDPTLDISQNVEQPRASSTTLGRLTVGVGLHVHVSTECAHPLAVGGAHGICRKRPNGGRGSWRGKRHRQRGQPSLHTKHCKIWLCCTAESAVFAFAFKF